MEKSGERKTLNAFYAMRGRKASGLDGIAV